MEHINIIAKEEITTCVGFPVYIVGALAIIGIIGTMLYFTKTKDFDKTVKGLAVFGFGGMVSMVITMLICSIFFTVPTGRYKYTASIDEDKITLAQYNEFLEQYRPQIRDGLYYWED